jgi:hypothetical protein
MDHRKISSLGGQARWKGKSKKEKRAAMMTLVEARRLKLRPTNQMQTINIALVDIMEYDLTLMAGDVAHVLTGKPGYLGLTSAQKKRVDRVVSKYAKRSVDIITSHRD